MTYPSPLTVVASSLSAWNGEPATPEVLTSMSSWATPPDMSFGSQLFQPHPGYADPIGAELAAALDNYTPNSDPWVPIPTQLPLAVDADLNGFYGSTPYPTQVDSAYALHEYGLDLDAHVVGNPEETSPPFDVNDYFPPY